MSIKLYQILTILLSPLIDLYMLIRLLSKKESKERFLERLGYAEIKRPEGKLIWFQCASVGESNSALPLIYKIIEKYDEKVSILLTSGTTTSAEIIKKKIADKANIIHQFTPIDKYFVIKRFLKHWKPDALITIESEIWPNMIVQSHKAGIKVMIVNAKVSDKSFEKWKKFKGMKEKVFDSIDICYPQTEEYQQKLITLGIQNTLFLGNLKFGISKLKINEEFLNSLKTSLEGKKVICCASTHAREEEKIAQLYKKLKKEFKNLGMIVAIRHPKRSDEVYNLFKSHDLNVKRKSKNEVYNSKTDIYMYDEMGEMGTLFEASDIVLMCGSLASGMGGHTPIEPAKHNCAIFTGPFIANNNSLFFELEKNNGCIISKETEDEKLAEELYTTAKLLLTDEAKMESLQKNAYNTCEKFANVVQNVADNLVMNLDK